MSTHNAESTLGLATASNLQKLGFETSNEKKKLVINKNNYNTVRLSGFILLTDTQGGSATQV
jgi:mannose/fructose-specific phosphotransferase system component IIA